jgi:hypothetical protein
VLRIRLGMDTWKHSIPSEGRRRKAASASFGLLLVLAASVALAGAAVSRAVELMRERA